jgi:hypothetical protein
MVRLQDNGSSEGDGSTIGKTTSRPKRRPIQSSVVRFMLAPKSAPLQPPSHDGAAGWTALTLRLPLPAKGANERAAK